MRHLLFPLPAPPHLAQGEKTTWEEVLREMIDQHENGLLGITPACIARAKALLERGAK